jgi:hypothetical protein
MKTSLTLDGLAAAHPKVGDLPTLLEKLHQLDHFDIGAERAQNATWLLARLAERGVALNTVEDAALWLAPVLCITARERRVLTERIRQEHPDVVEADVVGPDVPVLPGEARVAERQRISRRGWLVGAAAGLAVVLGLVVLAMIFSGPDPGPVDPNHPDTGLHFGFPYALAGMVMLVGAAVALVRLLMPTPNTALPPAADPPPIGQGLPWFDEGILQGPLRLMGGRRRVAGNWLDLPGTIRETVRSAGWPRIVRGGRLRTPEHVLLVQVASTDDPQVLIAATLLDRLRATDLRVITYTFQGAPNWLYPWLGGAPEPAPTVAAKVGGIRLLVLSDGSPFYDPFTGTARLPPAFEAFPTRVLITPVPRAAWGWREAALDRGGWYLAEQSTDSLADLARWLAGPREEPPLPVAEHDAPLDLPAYLRRTEAVFASEPPPNSQRQILRDEVAQWLDPDPREPSDAYDLLCCLAVGTHLSPGTIERVTGHIVALGGPSPGEDGLRRLLSLPWFARGDLPSWLREDLLRDLSQSLQAIARQAWLLHLADLNPGYRALRPEQEVRLAAEVRLRLANAGSIADSSMRAALGLGTQPARKLSRTGVLGAAALLLASVAAAYALTRYSLHLPRILDVLFAPLHWLVGEERLQLALLGPLVAVLPFQNRFLSEVWPLNESLRALLLKMRAPVALYCAGGLWWMSRDLSVLAENIVWAPWVGSILTTSGAVALFALRLPDDWVATRRLITLGHPWANALAVLLTAGLCEPTLLYMGLSLPATMTGIIGSMLLWQAGVAMVAYLILRRALGLGEANRKAARVLAARASGAAIVTIGLLTVAVGWVDRIHSIKLLEPQIVLDAGLLAAVLATLAATGSVAWRRVAVGAALYAVYATFVRTSPPAEPYATMLAMFPARLFFVGVVLYRPDVFRMLPVVATGLLGVGVAWLETLATGASDGGGSEVLLIWPLVRAIRPDLLVPSDGLWWRCLLLIPCWIDVRYNIGAPFGTQSLGLYPVLAIPIAAGIAARFGARSLPAIALALAPMAVSFHQSVGPLSIWLNGNLGYGLTALLVAKFVVDRGFRENSLGATRIAGWQILAVALLPLSYAPRTVYGVTFASDTWVLAIAVATLLGLSDVPLRRTLYTMLLASVVACGVTIAAAFALLPSGSIFGRLFYGLSNLPSDPLLIILTMGLGRALIAGPGEAIHAVPPMRWAMAAIQRRPLIVALVVAPLAFLVRLTLESGLGIGGGAGRLISLQPFSGMFYLALALFWAAAGIAPAWPPTRRLRGHDIPWSVQVAGAVLLPAMFVPMVNFGAKLSFRLFPYDVTEGIMATLGVYGFCRMGAALPPAVRSRLPATAQTHPVFATLPVRIGLGFALGAAVPLATIPVVSVFVTPASVRGSDSALAGQPKTQLRPDLRPMRRRRLPKPRSSGLQRQRGSYRGRRLPHLSRPRDPQGARCRQPPLHRTHLRPGYRTRRCRRCRPDACCR